MKTASGSLIMAVVLICFGCGSQTVDDASITTTVKAKLAADSQTSAIKIGVETANGVVVLDGAVPTEREKEKAEQLARNTEGVKKVDNRITINPNTVGATNVGDKTEAAINDVTILTKIKAKFVAEGIIGTDVDVRNGAVTLKGEVENSKEITQAANLARSTEGVTNVINQLTVKRR